jgi:hypothetical protein
MSLSQHQFSTVALIVSNLVVALHVNISLMVEEEDTCMSLSTLVVALHVHISGD